MHTFLDMIHNLGNGLHFIGLEADKLYKFVSKKVREAINMVLEKCTGDDLIDYKVYGNSKQSLLPDEYQEVEYIESTGTQHIDTGFKPTANTRMKIRFIHGSETTQPFGTVDSNDIGYVYASRWFRIFSRAGSQITTVPDGPTTFDIIKQKVYVNESLIYTGSTPVNMQNNLYLFARNNNNVVQYGSSKIYFCKIYDNDVLVRDFVPCYRKSDNAVGMYDLVNNVFYVSEGPNALIKGPNYQTPPTPDEKIEIKSVGDLVTEGEHAGKYKIPVKISGKNKLNFSDKNLTIANVNLSCSDGELTINGTSNSTVYGTNSVFKNNFSMELKSGKTYTLSRQTNEITIMINKKDDDTVIVSLPANSSTTSTNFTVPNDATYYLGMYIPNGATYSNLNYNAMLEEGSTATEYEPYHELITKYIYLDEPLRKIGDVADDIDFGAKKRINKVGVYDFDVFSGGAVVQSVANPDYYYAYSSVLDELALANDSTANELCTRLKVIPTMITSTNVTSDSIALGKGWAHLRVMILKSRIDDLSGSTLMYKLQTFFNENPTVLFYELLTPTEENIDLPEIPTFEGTTIIEVDTEVQPSNMWVQYYAKE